MAEELPLVLLDGESLSIETLFALGDGKMHLGLTPEAWQRVSNARAVVDNILTSGKVCHAHASVHASVAL
jgi:histidine ammonia-lyase